MRNTDSMVSIENGIVVDYPIRESIGQVQTPQGFPFGIIYDLHVSAVEDSSCNATDDGSLVWKAGLPLLVIDGESQNRKITVSTDLSSYG
jgi:2-C-methyl-D-erythritol 4-phosphate cytidylyltransferase